MYETNRGGEYLLTNDQKGLTLMSNEIGMEYYISQGIISHFNSAEILTVIHQKGNIVQFTLSEGKGYGSMPVQHLHYLLKKADLTRIINKQSLLQADEEDERIS